MDTYGGCILIPSIVPNAINHNWLVVEPTPLKNDGVRQLGWWHSQLNGKKQVPIHQPDSDFWLYTCEKNACTTGENDGIVDVPRRKTIDIMGKEVDTLRFHQLADGGIPALGISPWENHQTKWGTFRCRPVDYQKVPSGKHTKSYWKWQFLVVDLLIKERWFSIQKLVYQRVHDQQNKIAQNTPATFG